MAVLRILSGPGRSTDFELHDHAEIGRDPSCSLPLDAPEIPLRAARFHQDDEGFRIQVLTPGCVRINGVAHESARLKDGSLLLLGSSIRLLYLVSSESTVPRASVLASPPAIAEMKASVGIGPRGTDEDRSPIPPTLMGVPAPELSRDHRSTPETRADALTPELSLLSDDVPPNSDPRQVSADLVNALEPQKAQPANRARNTSSIVSWAGPAAIGAAMSSLMSTLILCGLVFLKPTWLYVVPVEGNQPRQDFTVDSTPAANRVGQVSILLSSALRGQTARQGDRSWPLPLETPLSSDRASPLELGQGKELYRIVLREEGPNGRSREVLVRGEPAHEASLNRVQGEAAVGNKIGHRPPGGSPTRQPRVTSSDPTSRPPQVRTRVELEAPPLPASPSSVAKMVSVEVDCSQGGSLQVDRGRVNPLPWYGTLPAGTHVFTFVLSGQDRARRVPISWVIPDEGVKLMLNVENSVLFVNGQAHRLVTD